MSDEATPNLDRLNQGAKVEVLMAEEKKYGKPATPEDADEIRRAADRTAGDAQALRQILSDAEIPEDMRLQRPGPQEQGSPVTAKSDQTRWLT